MQLQLLQTPLLQKFKNITGNRNRIRFISDKALKLICPPIDGKDPGVLPLADYLARRRDTSLSLKINMTTERNKPKQGGGRTIKSREISPSPSCLSHVGALPRYWLPAKRMRPSFQFTTSEDWMNASPGPGRSLLTGGTYLTVTVG